MVEIKATHKYPIPLGRTGENEAARIAFTLAPFEEVFPGGTPALLVKRKGDSAAYPVTLTVDGLTAYWTVTSADTDKAGFGQCELQWHLGDTLAKSNKFDFIVVPALEAGAEPPDAPSKRWFDAIQAQIGDLSKLTTKAKDNLVAAINEAARSGGGPGGAGTIDMRVADGYIQYSNDDGATWENLIAVDDLKGADGKDGTNGTDGKDGAPGAAGKDGHTPVITASKSGKVTTIKADGEVIATVNDGADGTDGAPGAAGKDGVTPDIKIGTVTTLPAGSEATASMGGTAAQPTLNLGIPQGAPGGGANVTKEAVVDALGFTPISADDVPVKSVNGQTGEAKTNWYFNVTGSVASPSTTQTAAQIVAAQKAGFAPICSATFSDFQGLPATLPALLISSAVCVFGGIGSTGGDTFYLTVMIDAARNLTAKTDNVAAKGDIPEIPSALKNPNALNIKIGDTTTSYDGSAAKTVEIPEGTDGYSPSASVAQTDTGAKITITDKTGTTEVEVKNGKDGTKGDKGETGGPGPQGPAGADYVLTDADKTQIAEAVIADGQEVQLGGDVPAPTDAQVSSAVSTWLTEHPEATTTVQDGAVTPPKTSFLEQETASIMGLGEYKKSFSYSIKNDGSYYIHSWNKNYNFKADITGLTKIIIRATAAYINYVFFAEAPTGAAGQTVIGHGGTFAGQTKLNETDANEPTAQTVEIDVPDNAVWLMVDFGYTQPTELMIGKPIAQWKFGDQIDKAVNGADITDETVDTQKLTDGAVTTEKLANRSVSTDKLAGYSTVCRDVPWELFLDGYGTSVINTVENAACAIYSVKFEAGKTYCILNLPYPNNTNELVTDPTDINNFGYYFSYYPALPDVAANLAAGKDRLYGYKKANNIQQVLLKAESDGYVETAIPGQALSMPPVYFTVKQDWYVLRASTKPDAGKRVNNYYVAELQMTGISTVGNGMHGQSWYVYKKDLGNGFASDRGFLQQIFASKMASAENERAYAAMSRDIPRDRTLNIHFIGDSITYAASNAGLQNAFRKYVPMNLRAETMALCQNGVSVTTGSGSIDWNGKLNTDAAYDAAMSGYSGLAQKLAEYKTNLSLAAWADAVDIVVVELGTNDHWEQAALGVQTNLTEDTNFYGAVEKTLTLLEDTFPHAQILWLLPFKNQKWKTSTVKLVDYLIALKILCQMHTRCWTLDLFDKWFLDYDDTDLRSKFFIDGVHITGNAHKCVAESMIDKIRQIISVCGLRQTETVHVTAANDSVYGSAT